MRIKKKIVNSLIFLIIVSVLTNMTSSFMYVHANDSVEPYSIEVSKPNTTDQINKSNEGLPEGTPETNENKTTENNANEVQKSEIVLPIVSEGEKSLPEKEPSTAVTQVLDTSIPLNESNVITKIENSSANKVRFSPMSFPETTPTVTENEVVVLNGEDVKDKSSYYYFMFIPDATATYSLKASGTVIPYMSVYNSQDNCIGRNRTYPKYYDSMAVKLYKGQQYFINISSLSIDASTEFSISKYKSSSTSLTYTFTDNTYTEDENASVIVTVPQIAADLFYGILERDILIEAELLKDGESIEKISAIPKENIRGKTGTADNNIIQFNCEFGKVNYGEYTVKVTCKDTEGNTVIKTCEKAISIGNPVFINVPSNCTYYASSNQVVYFKNINTNNGKVVVLDNGKVIGAGTVSAMGSTSINYDTLFSDYLDTSYQYDSSKFKKELYYTIIPNINFVESPKAGNIYDVKIVSGVSEYFTTAKLKATDDLILNNVSTNPTNSFHYSTKIVNVSTSFYNFENVNSNDISVDLLDFSGNIVGSAHCITKMGYDAYSKITSVLYVLNINRTLDETQKYSIRISYPGKLLVNSKSSYLSAYFDSYLSIGYPIILDYENPSIKVPTYSCNHTLEYDVVLYRQNQELKIPISKISGVKPDNSNSFNLDFPNDGNLPLLMPASSYYIEFTYKNPSNGGYIQSTGTSFNTSSNSVASSPNDKVLFYPPVLPSEGEVELTISGYEIDSGIMGKDNKNINIELVADDEVYGTLKNDTITKSASYYNPSSNYIISQITLKGILQISKKLKEDTQYNIIINGKDYSYFYNSSKQDLSNFTIKHYCSSDLFKDSNGKEFPLYNLSQKEPLELNCEWFKGSSGNPELSLVNIKTSEKFNIGTFKTVETNFGGTYKNISLTSSVENLPAGEIYELYLKSEDTDLSLNKYIKVSAPVQASNFSVQEAVYGSDDVVLSISSCQSIDGMYFNVLDSLDNIIDCTVVENSTRKGSSNRTYFNIKTDSPLKYGEYTFRMISSENVIKYSFGYRISKSAKKPFTRYINNGIPYLIYGDNFTDEGLYTADIYDSYSNEKYKTGIPLSKKDGESILELKDSELNGLPVGSYYYVNVYLNNTYIGNVSSYYSGPFNVNPSVYAAEWLDSTNTTPLIKDNNVELILKTMYYTKVRYSETLEDLKAKEYQPITNTVAYEFGNNSNEKILYFQFVDDYSKESEIITFKAYLPDKNEISINSPKENTSYTEELSISANVANNPHSVWAVLDGLTYYYSQGEYRSYRTINTYRLEKAEGTDSYSVIVPAYIAKGLIKADFHTSDKFGNITGSKTVVLKEVETPITPPAPSYIQIDSLKQYHNTQEITVSGKNATPGSDVYIIANPVSGGESIYTTVLANEAGDFEGNLKLANIETYIITVSDSKGKTCGGNVAATIDTVSPILKDYTTVAQGVNSVKLSWDVTDYTQCSYDIFRDGKLLLSDYSQKQYLAVNLNKGQTYIYRVIAKDSAGNKSAPIDITVVCGDTEAPAAPKNIKVVSHASKSITLSWEPATDNSYVTGYEIYRDNIKVGISYTTSYKDTGLTADQEYSYSIKSFDPSYNYSPFSETFVHATKSVCVKDAYNGKSSVIGYTTKVLTLQAIIDDNLNSDNITVTFSYSGDGGNNWYNTGTVNKYTTTPSGLLFTTTWNIQNATVGDYILKYTAKDRDGCTHEAFSESISILKVEDNEKPQITSIYSSSNRFANTIPIHVTFVDNLGLKRIGLQSSLDNTLWEDVVSIDLYNKSEYTWDYNINVSKIREGNYYLRAVATDVGNNKNNISDSSCVQYIIDRTAPETVKDLSNFCYDDYIEIRWSNSDPDIDSFSVLRSEKIDGDYSIVASNIQYLNYFDNSAAPGKTYYYKVMCKDTAGNLSPVCEPIEAKVLGTGTDDMTPPVEDTIPPKITSVYPANNTVIGSKLTYVLTAEDNIRLSKLAAEYTTDNKVWKEFHAISSSGILDGFTAEVDTTQFPSGTVLKTRAYAVDSKGNVSDYEYRDYKIENSAPKTPVVSVVPIARGLNVSWSCDDLNIKSFKLYRKKASSEFFTVVGNYPATTLSVEDKNLDPLEKYMYRLAAINQLGNTSIALSPYFSPIDLDDVLPSPYINCVSSSETEMDIIFDGSESKDNVKIAEYIWDLGDGTIKKGSTITHSYITQGVYTVVLKVIDSSGNEATAQKTINILKKNTSGTLNVTVTDNSGKSVPYTNIYVNVGQDNQFKQLTDSNGKISLKLKPGVYNIGAYKKDYSPKQQEVLITENKENNLNFILEESKMVVGGITATKMTLDQIQKAGIDVTAPGNQNIFTYQINLTYNNKPYTINHIPSASGSSTTYSVGGRNIEACTFYDLGSQKNTPFIMLIDIPGTVTWLKDFFDVNLYVQNVHETYAINDCAVKLNIPAGISLAGGNDQTVSLGKIAAKEVKTASWIVRGDTPGEYNLSADFNGILESFNEPISVPIVTSNPIVVENSSNLKLIIEVEDIKYADDNVLYRVGFKNEKNSDLNKPSISMAGSTFLRSYKTYENMSLSNTSAEVLKPDEILWNEYSLNTEIFKDCSNCFLLLKDLASKSLGGMTMPIETRTVPYGTFGRARVQISVIDPATGRESNINTITLVKYRSKENDIMPDLKIKVFKGIAGNALLPEACELTIDDSMRDSIQTVRTDENGEYIYKGGSIDNIKVDDDGISMFSICAYSNTSKVGDAYQYIKIIDQNQLSKEEFGTLSGMVWNSDLKKPIKGATITYDTYTTRTDDMGKFKFKDILLKKDSMTIEAEGFSEKEISQEFNDGTFIYVPMSSVPEVKSVTSYVSDSTKLKSSIIPTNLIESLGGSLMFRVEADTKDSGKVKRYLYKIVDKNNNTKYSGESTVKLINVENICDKMAVGDRILFAIETEGVSNPIISEYVDAKLVMAKEFTFLNSVAWNANVANELKEAFNPDIVEGIDGFLEFSTGDGLPRIEMPEDSGIFKSAGLSAADANFDFDVEYDFYNAKAKFTTRGGIKFGADGALAVLELPKGTSETNTEGDSNADNNPTVDGDPAKSRLERTIGIEYEGNATVSIVCVYDEIAMKWLIESFEIQFDSGVTISVEFKFIVPLDATFGGALLSGYAAVTIEGGIKQTMAVSIEDIESFDSLRDLMVEMQTILSLSLKAAIGLEVGYGLLSGEFWAKGGIEFTIPTCKTVLSLSYGYGYGYLWFFSDEAALGEKSWVVYDPDKESEKNVLYSSNINKNRSAIIEYAALDTFGIAQNEEKALNTFQDEDTVLKTSSDEEMVFETSPRDYLENQKWIGKEEIIQNAYPQSDAHISAIDEKYGDLIMVFVGDDSERTDNNRTSLYYSIYSNNKWSEPVQIDNDGTADAYPGLATDGDDSYAVWLDMSEKIGDLPAVSEDYITKNILSKMNVNIAKFDFQNGVWKNVLSPKTEGVNKLPKIATQGNKTVATWVNNSSCNAIGTSEHADSVYYVYNNGTGWTEPKPFITDAKNVYESDLFIQNGKAYYAFITNAYSNDGLYKLYVSVFDGKNWSTPKALLNNNSNDSHPSIALENDNPVVFWHNDGSIYKAPIEGNNLEIIISSEQANGLLELQATNTDDGIALAWINAVAGEQRLYISTYEDSSSTWTQGIEIKHNSMEIPKDVTIAGNANEIMAVYNKTVIKYDEEAAKYHREGTSLTSTSYVRKTDLAIPSNGIYFENETVLPGEKTKAYVAVENIGDFTAKNISVSLYNGENLIGKKVMSESISHGNKLLTDFDYQIPDGCLELNIKGVVEVANDSDTSNNTCQLNMSFADVEIATVQNVLYEKNSGFVYVDVVNNGFSSINNIKVEISTDNEFKNILETKEISALNPYQTRRVVFDINASDEQIANRARIYSRVSVVSTEFNYANNSNFTIIRPSEDIPVITSETSPGTGDIPGTRPDTNPGKTDAGNQNPSPGANNSGNQANQAPTDIGTQTGGTKVEDPQEEIPLSPNDKKAKAYIKGYEDNTFRPDNNLTRAEMAVIIATLDGESTKPYTDAGFKDVSKDHWAAWAISYSCKKGYFKGYEDNTFKPDRYITRAEISTVLCKYLNLEMTEKADNKFTDISNHWAQGYIKRLLSEGFIKGYPDDTFKPNNNVKRSECVSLVNRILGLTPIKDAQPRFKDVALNHWAFGDIMAATSAEK